VKSPGGGKKVSHVPPRVAGNFGLRGKMVSRDGKQENGGLRRKGPALVGTGVEKKKVLKTY